MTNEHPIDEVSAERLLSGLVEPEDAPSGYAEVARMMQAAVAPASPSELQHEKDAVDAAVLMVRDQLSERNALTERNSLTQSSWALGERSRSRHFKAKLTGLLVAATLVGSTGLAFAGALPPGLQNAASSFLSHVGVTVPNDHPTNKGGTISQIATTTTATGVDKGAQISTVASNGHSQAGQHGRPSGTARQSGSHGQSGSHSQAGEHAQNGSDGGESTNAGSPGSADGGTAGAAQAGGGGSSSGSGHGGNGP